MGSKKNASNDLSEEILEYLENKGVRIESFIAKGGYSYVYKAISGDNRLAVKVIKLEKNPKEVRKELLINEAQIASQVNHEYIVKTHSVFELKDNYLFIVSDFADGGDLITILDKNIPLEEPTIQRWFSHIVKAVEYLHTNGIAHRDIKPDNVLIDNTVAKLTDFGYAKVSINSDRNVIKTRDSCGTLEYLSPEQIVCILDDDPYDPFISDCYCLGVLLFLMVELDFPYPNTGQWHKNSVLKMILNKQLKQKWELKDKYSGHQNIISLLKQLLQPDVNTRIKCSQILWHPWLKGFVSNK